MKTRYFEDIEKLKKFIDEYLMIHGSGKFNIYWIDNKNKWAVFTEVK